MSSRSPESPFDQLPIGPELALLDIQTEQSRQLHDIGLHAAAIAMLASHGLYPSNTLVRTAVYEFQREELSALSQGGVVLLGNDGRSIWPQPLAKVLVYSRIGQTIIPEADYSQSQATMIQQLTADARRYAKCAGIVLTSDLVDLFRTPVEGRMPRPYAPTLR